MKKNSINQAVDDHWKYWFRTICWPMNFPPVISYSLRTWSHGPVEIVDLPMNSMVILQFVCCKRLPESTQWSSIVDNVSPTMPCCSLPTLPFLFVKLIQQFTIRSGLLRSNGINLVVSHVFHSIPITSPIGDCWIFLIIHLFYII